MTKRASHLVLFLMLGCERKLTPPPSFTTDGAPSSAPTIVALTPITSAPAASASSLPMLVTPRKTTPATITTAARKSDPFRACCDALRKQPQPQSAQAAAMCDGVAAAIDDTGEAPQLEQLVKPVLADVPLPAACKGL